MPVVTPLPSGSGVDRNERSPEARQPSEEPIAIRAKLMIDANAELILIDRLVVDATIVIRGAGAGRQRIAIQQRLRDRVDAIDRNRVVRRTAAASRRRRSGPSSPDRR